MFLLVLFAANIDVKGHLLCGCNWLWPRLMSEVATLGGSGSTTSSTKNDKQITNHLHVRRFLGFETLMSLLTLLGFTRETKSSAT
mmetsp:Transcript_11186/g.26131  ORF Transcript_11186/g.26131 Transcript_11186/m.26131 type:complete len:85 (-) Transcript_11186:634-888(-)